MTTSIGAWFYGEITPASPSAFPVYAVPDVAFDFSPHMVKLQATGGDIEISYDGKNVHHKAYAANGLQDFPGLAVGKLYIRGTGTLRVTAWGG